MVQISKLNILFIYFLCVFEGLLKIKSDPSVVLHGCCSEVVITASPSATSTAAGVAGAAAGAAASSALVLLLLLDKQC